MRYSFLLPRHRGRLVALALLSLHLAAACAPVVRTGHQHAEPAEERPVETPTHAEHAEHAAPAGLAPTTHPTPRPEATPDRVADASRVEAKGYPEQARVYALAKEIPQVLDGIYCHCDCSKRHAHYSLLTCFETGHGVLCRVCLESVVRAHELHKEGKTLEQIRAAIDAEFAV